MKSDAFRLDRCAGRLLWAAIVCLGWAGWISDAVGAESRTWTDKSGKFKIEAKFVELSDGKGALQVGTDERVA